MRCLPLQHSTLFGYGQAKAPALVRCSAGDNMECSTKPDKENFMLAGVSIPRSLHMGNRPEGSVIMPRKKSTAADAPRLVAYYRYSGGSRQTEQSIEGQRRDCEAYARAHGMTILREYVDRHISGKTDDRPAFQQLVADSAAHTFDAVICWKTAAWPATATTAPSIRKSSGTTVWRSSMPPRATSPVPRASSLRA